MEDIEAVSTMTAVVGARLRGLRQVKSTYSESNSGSASDQGTQAKQIAKLAYTLAC